MVSDVLFGFPWLRANTSPLSIPSAGKRSEGTHHNLLPPFSSKSKAMATFVYNL